MTTSRGVGNTLAMAEYVVASILHFAKGLHRAAVDRSAGAFDHRAYRPLLLEGKTVCVVGAGGKDTETLWGMPSLGEAFHARPLEVIMHSYFEGPRSFVVGLDSPDGRYRIHMNLSGLTWRMSGVDVPEPITARVTRLIAQRIGGAVDLPKD